MCQQRPFNQVPDQSDRDFDRDPEPDGEEFEPEFVNDLDRGIWRLGVMLNQIAGMCR